MPGIIECAVLLNPVRENWLKAWIARNVGASPRLHLHVYELGQGNDGAPSVHALRDVNLSMRRYDTAILPISYASLSWARTALAGAVCRYALPIPLLALVEGLRAPAIQDLFALGVADFLREDSALEDLRVRLTQMTSAQGPTACAGWQRACDDTHTPAWPGVETDPALTQLTEAGPCQQETGDAMARDARPAADETFRTAKTRVVACFERDYIDKALSRHAGNISMAARSAQKHRRAFWALMRKHRIDAAPYRQPSCATGADVSVQDQGRSG